MQSYKVGRLDGERVKVLGFFVGFRVYGLRAKGSGLLEVKGLQGWEFSKP